MWFIPLVSPKTHIKSNVEDYGCQINDQDFTSWEQTTEVLEKIKYITREFLIYESLNEVVVGCW